MNEVLSGARPDAEYRLARRSTNGASIRSPSTRQTSAPSSTVKTATSTAGTSPPTRLTPGLNLAPATGEAYTSTLIGPDGAVYAMNDAQLFCCAAQSLPAGSSRRLDGLARRHGV